MQSNKSFRAWLNEIWLAHKEEILELEHKLPDYDSAEYFRRLKWWLKREYLEHIKHQKG